MMLKSSGCNMKKRSLTNKENIYEGKRSKQGDFGDDAPWIRRSVVGKATYGSVFIANMKALFRRIKSLWLLEFDVKRYGRSILKGLGHVLKRGYVHCNLKPENILIVPNKNSDGFIAKVEAVISGVQKPSADIWAFGCIVFEMLTGKKLWLAYKDLGKNEVLRRVGYENEIKSVISSSRVSNKRKSFLQGCLSKKVVRRLSADKLLNHPFLKQFVDDDDVNEVDESQGIWDINAITSYSSFFDDEDGSGYEGSDDKGSDDKDNDDELQISSDRSSYAFSPWIDRAADARLNEVRIPKKMCSLGLMRFDLWMEFLMVHLEELEMKKLLQEKKKKLEWNSW
nr:mitogen-activated protein kinase kinase kinase 17-like [Tanacetum cinerariifolium]